MVRYALIKLVALSAGVAAAAAQEDIKPGEFRPEPLEPVRVQLFSGSYVILTPRVVEVTIPGTTPLDRNEFRKLCDKYETASEIADALENREPQGRKKKNIYEDLGNMITSELASASE